MKDPVEAFVELLHRGQKRKTGDPYTSHLYAVRDILKDVGVKGKHTLMAALLHDCLEDSDVTREYLAYRFGEKVADLVVALSKDKVWNTAFCNMKGSMDILESVIDEYPEAILIKMADRLHNLRTIDGFTSEKQHEYIEETKECLIPVFKNALELNKLGSFRKAYLNLLNQIASEVEKIEKSF